MSTPLSKHELDALLYRVRNEAHKGFLAEPGQEEWRKTLSFTRRGAAVKRCHTLPTLRENTVGQHSFNGCWLAILLLRNTPEGARLLNLCLRTLLLHDLAECEVGDIPSPVKHKLFSTEIDAFESAQLEAHGLRAEVMAAAQPHTLAAHICKLADAAELALFCAEENAFGNKTASIQRCHDNATGSAVRSITTILGWENISSELRQNVVHLLGVLYDKHNLTI